MFLWNFKTNNTKEITKELLITVLWSKSHKYAVILIRVFGVKERAFV
jgi:hypothetical protein